MGALSPARNIVIRRALADDAYSLAALCRQHAAYECLAALPPDLEPRLQRALVSEVLFVWMAIVDEQANGYLSATEDYSTLACQRYLHMDCLYLCEDVRRLGISVQLLRAACELGRRRECVNLQWQTPDWNFEAIRFYERSGANPLDKVRFSLPLQPELIWW